MLTDEEIEEFRRLWKEEFGQEISYKEAHDRALEIATYFEIVAEIANKNPSPDNSRKKT